MLFLFGCGKSNEIIPIAQESSVKNNSPLIQRIEAARKEKQLANDERSVGLTLENTKNEDGIISIEIWLSNPKKNPISSVRSFLAFDTEVLEGKEINIPEESPFTIVAPGEQEFDARNGIVKIGLSTSEGKVVTEEKVLVASVKFFSKNKVFTTIDFYDPGDEGHTLVLEKSSDGVYRDVLKTPSIPTLVFLEQQ